MNDLSPSLFQLAICGRQPWSREHSQSPHHQHERCLTPIAHGMGIIGGSGVAAMFEQRSRSTSCPPRLPPAQAWSLLPLKPSWAKPSADSRPYLEETERRFGVLDPFILRRDANAQYIPVDVLCHHLICACCCFCL